MSEGRDPQIQSLFDRQAEKHSSSLDDGDFTIAVMRKTGRYRYRLHAVLALIALSFLMVAWWLSWPLLEIASIASLLLDTELVDLGENVVAWLLFPVNNIAALLVLLWRLLRLLTRRAAHARYVN